MASKKSNGGRRSIAPSVLSALTITPAIIKAVEELIGAQIAARMALPFLPWSQYMVATGYSKYKVKK